MEKKPGLTAATIKLIAVICMFIDHATASVYQALLYSGRLDFGQNGLDPSALGFIGMGDISENAMLIYVILRAIGRISFPLYCFFIVEGFKYTRCKWKYLLRLIIFALISEIPFDMAIFGYMIYPFYQNVFFTLAAGLAMIMGIDALKDKELKKTARVWLRIAAIFLAPHAFTALFINYAYEIYLALCGKGYLEQKDVLIMMLALYFIGMLIAGVSMIIVSNVRNAKAGMNYTIILAFFGAACVLTDQKAMFGLSSDYGAMGIATILIIYLLRNYRLPSFLAGCGTLSVFSVSEIPCFLAVPLISNYNGERGKGNKYFFYAFYPAHLFILGVITIFVLRLTVYGMTIDNFPEQIMYYGFFK